MSGALFKRGRERGRCAAGLFADAAGELGVRRSDGFASRMGMAGPREALAKARHPWAMLCNPFGVGVRRSDVEEDVGSWLGRFIEFSKTHFRLAGYLLRGRRGLRRRRAEDSPPYLGWVMRVPSAGRALGPPSDAERPQSRFSELDIGNRCRVMERKQEGATNEGRHFLSGSQSRVRHALALLCNPFGVGVGRSGVVEDGGWWLGRGNVLRRGQETPIPWIWFDRRAEGLGGWHRGQETPTPWIWIARRAEGLGGWLRGRMRTLWIWIDRKALKLSGANIATKN
jgi:hypothetical protein